MTRRTRSFLSVGRKMLRREFRIRDVAVGAIHLIGESLDFAFCLDSLRSFFSDIDSELLKFSEYFDDILFQSS